MFNVEKLILYVELLNVNASDEVGRKAENEKTRKKRTKHNREKKIEKKDGNESKRGTLCVWGGGDRKKC